MTVSNNIRRSGPYLGNGVSADFAYEFRILDAAHLRVVLRAADGAETTLAPGTDYTVSAVGADGGGNVTLATAPASGETITIIRNMPLTQGVDLENQGEYYAETVEQGLDATVMAIQQLREELDRSVKVPVSGDVAEVDELMANVRTIAAMADDVEAVAGDLGAVETLAGAIADVEAVAASISAVAAVAANTVPVATVAAHAAEVAALAEEIGSVVLAAAKIAAIEAAPAAAQAAVSSAALVEATVDAARLGSVPVGAEANFAGATPPAGWLARDGQAVSRAAFPQLFKALGARYGNGDGTTTFNLPNAAHDPEAYVTIWSTKIAGAAGMQITKMHTENARPLFMELVAQVLVPFEGYGVGDEIVIGAQGSGDGGASNIPTGFTFYSNDMEFGTRASNTSALYYFFNKNTGTLSTQPYTSFDFYVRGLFRKKQQSISCIKAADGIDNPGLIDSNGLVAQVAALEQKLSISQQIFHIQDQKPSGTNGGTFTQGAWRTRDINTVVKSTIAGSGLSANRFSMMPGTYDVDIQCVAYACSWSRIRLYNKTKNEVAALGLTQFSQATNSGGYAYGDAFPAALRHRLTLSEETTFEVQHICQYTRVSDGFGVAVGQGVPEIYSDILVRRVA